MIETMTFIHVDEDYNKHKTSFQYEIEMKEGVITTIRNEFGFKVDEKSYVWE